MMVALEATILLDPVAYTEARTVLDIEHDHAGSDEEGSDMTNDRLAARTFYHRAVETEHRELADKAADLRVADVLRANQVDAEHAKRRRRRERDHMTLTLADARTPECFIARSLP